MPRSALNVNEDDIRRRAYEIFQDRGRRGAPGSAIDDWVRAERELHSSNPRPRR